MSSDPLYPTQPHLSCEHANSFPSALCPRSSTATASRSHAVSRGKPPPRRTGAVRKVLYSPLPNKPMCSQSFPWFGSSARLFSVHLPLGSWSSFPSIATSQCRDTFLFFSVIQSQQVRSPQTQWLVITWTLRLLSSSLTTWKWLVESSHMDSCSLFLPLLCYSPDTAFGFFDVTLPYRHCDFLWQWHGPNPALAVPAVPALHHTAGQAEQSGVAPCLVSAAHCPRRPFPRCPWGIS